jgi:hypothetical protein
MRPAKIPLRLSFAVLCTVSTALILTAAILAGQQPAQEDRAAWRYTQKEMTVTYVQQPENPGEWIAERSDGKRPQLTEVSRTAEYVELQNQETKLLIRLHAEQSFWKRPKDTDWTPWVKGSWVALPQSPPPEPPKPAGEKTKPAPPDPAPAPESPQPAPADLSPSGSSHRVRLAYFVPRDRRPVANYEAKIRVVMSIVAELYRHDLESKGYRTSGLTFEVLKEQLVIVPVRGERDASYYNNAPAYDADEQFRRLSPEIRQRVGDPQRQVIVVFAETYDEGASDVLWPGVLARGGYNNANGGLAVFSSHLLRDEFAAPTIEEQRRLFFDRTPIPGRKAWGHAINSPRCEFIEDGIGAVAHELGHALGLPHDRRDDTREIMGNGFRNLRWNFEPNSPRRVGFSDENAALLMSSRYLAPDLDLRDNQPPRIEAMQVARGAGGWTVSIKASDNLGLRAVVFIDREAGSIVGGRRLSGKMQTFQENLPAIKATSGLRLQAVLTDDGGNQTRSSDS